MVGHNDFGNGAHAHGIAADYTEVFIFCRSLECRTGRTYVNAVHQAQALLVADSVGKLDEFMAVGFCHRRETRTELVVVVTAERIFGEKIDMVCDYHHVAHLEFLVHAAGCVRHEKRLHAKLLEDTHRESHGLHVIAFVIMEAALHRNHGLASHTAENKVAAVSLYC